MAKKEKKTWVGWEEEGFGSDEEEVLAPVTSAVEAQEVANHGAGEHPAMVRFGAGLDGQTLRHFWDEEWKRRTLIVGPVGSGKTTTAIWKLVKLCEQSVVDPDPEKGYAEFYGYVLRSEKNKCEQVAKDMSEVFQLCGWQNAHVRTSQGGSWGIDTFKEFVDEDGELRTVKGQVVFTGTRGSGKSDSSITGGVLLGKNLTWVYVNECREVGAKDIHFFGSRCRFPGYGLKNGQWHGVIMDTNPAGKRSWTTDKLNDKRNGKIDPMSMWEVYDQPPAAWRSEDGSYVENLKSENRKNLPDTYYSDMVHDDDIEPTWKDRNLCCIPVDDPVGRLVWENFDQQRNVFETADRVDIEVKSPKLVLGQDFGFQGCVLFALAYMDKSNGWCIDVIDEVKAEGRATMEMWWEVDAKIKEIARGEHRSGFSGKVQQEAAKQLVLYGDPAGSNRDSVRAENNYMFYQQQVGLNAMPVHSNDIQVRVNSVTEMLALVREDGGGRLQIHTGCEWLLMAMKEGYVYEEKSRMKGAEVVIDKTPTKGEFSHVADALQYLSMGVGYNLGHMSSAGSYLNMSAEDDQQDDSWLYGKTKYG